MRSTGTPAWKGPLMYHTFTYRIEGVSRSLLAELARHRRLSLPVHPPAIHDPDGGNEDTNTPDITT